MNSPLDQYLALEAAYHAALGSDQEERIGAELDRLWRHLSEADLKVLDARS